jgi:hypothetical protein
MGPWMKRRSVTATSERYRMVSEGAETIIPDKLYTVREYHRKHAVGVWQCCMSVSYLYH